MFFRLALAAVGSLAIGPEVIVTPVSEKQTGHVKHRSLLPFLRQPAVRKWAVQLKSHRHTPTSLGDPSPKQKAPSLYGELEEKIAIPGTNAGWARMLSDTMCPIPVQLRC
jgi:hypothetical protein